MYYLIYTVVPSGHAGDVIHAAEAAGSLGGTVIHAKGEGRHPLAKLFSFEIEPMREIVMIIVEDYLVKEVSQSIYDRTELAEEGHGILFVQKVSRVEGLVQQKPVVEE